MLGENSNGKQGGSAAVVDNTDDLAAAIKVAASGGEGTGAGGDEGGGAGEGTGGGAADVIVDDQGAGKEAQEPEYIKSLKTELAELKQWKDDQTRTYAEEQERQKAEQNKPRERTDQEWGDIEKLWGMNTSTDKETGEKTLHVEPRKLIDTIVKTLHYAMTQQQERFDRALHERTSSYQLESVFADLEKRPSAPVSDVRQYSAAIREYLGKRYHPKDHSNAEYVMDAYYWAKGRGMKDAQKKIENSMELKKRVIHAAGGGSAGQGKEAGAPKPSGDASTVAFLEKFGA